VKSLSVQDTVNVLFRMVTIAVVAVLLCALCSGLPAEAQKLYGDVFTHPAIGSKAFVRTYLIPPSAYSSSKAPMAAVRSRVV